MAHDINLESSMWWPNEPELRSECQVSIIVTLKVHVSGRISASEISLIIPENFQELQFEWPCQIETHIIVENSWKFPRKARTREILIDKPLKIFGNFREFYEVASFLKNSQEILGVYWDLPCSREFLGNISHGKVQKIVMGVICDLIKQRLEIKMIAIDTSSCKTAELIFPFLFLWSSQPFSLFDLPFATDLHSVAPSNWAVCSISLLASNQCI